MWHTFVKAGSGRAGVIVSLKQDKNEKPKSATCNLGFRSKAETLETVAKNFLKISQSTLSVDLSTGYCPLTYHRL